MNSIQLLLFIPTALLIALAPGPDNLGVLALGLSAGRRASFGFALGCASGCLNHTLLATLGITALLAASPTALQCLQIAGAGYLVWIGWQSLRQLRRPAEPFSGQAPAEARAFAPHFRRGLIANAINPKVALFFLAFLPQFIQPDGWSSSAQTAALGLLFTLCAGLIFCLIAAASASLGRFLQRKPAALSILHALSGLLFIALALRLALADLPPRPVSAPV
jgi:threonine/homoserine/homoserine lactone efflux protein